MNERLLLVLEPDGLLLALAPDPDGRAPALARAAGHALSYLARGLADDARARAAALGRAFAAAGGADPVAALRRAAASLGATVRLRWAVPVGYRAPRWPVALRSGAPAPGSLWPYDAELAGLLLGRRRLLLREALSPARVEADAAWLEAHGLATRLAGDVLMGGADAAVVAEAAPLLPLVGAPGDEGRAAERALGALLGYPRCCVESFVRLAERDDAALFAALLASPPRPLPRRALWLSGALTLISHAPCAPDCPETLALAAAVLAELDRRHPGFADRWLPLAARVHVLDAAGRCYALRLQGETIAAADELVPGEPAGALRPAPSLVGQRADALAAVFVADHTAPG